jgi:hypothetical protein
MMDKIAARLGASAYCPHTHKIQHCAFDGQNDCVIFASLAHNYTSSPSRCARGINQLLWRFGISLFVY